MRPHCSRTTSELSEADLEEEEQEEEEEEAVGMEVVPTVGFEVANAAAGEGDDIYLLSMEEAEGEISPRSS